MVVPERIAYAMPEGLDFVDASLAEPAAVGVTAPIRMAIDLVRKGGTVTLIGNLSPTVELPLQSVVTRQITLYGSCAMAGEYPVVLDLMARKKIDVRALVSAVAPLSEGAAWFDRLYKREPGLLKVVLEP